MNNIANLSTIFMNFQGAINGLRGECETLKGELQRANQEISVIKDIQSQPQPAPQTPSINVDEALESVRDSIKEYVKEYVNDYFNEHVKQQVKDQLDTHSTDINKTIADVVEENKKVSTGLSTRMSVVENRHVLTADDVKGLIDASLAILIADLSAPATAPEVSAPLEPIPEVETHLEEVSPETSSTEVEIEPEPVASTPAKKAGRGRGRGKKAT